MRAYQNEFVVGAGSKPARTDPAEFTGLQEGINGSAEPFGKLKA